MFRLFPVLSQNRNSTSAEDFKFKPIGLTVSISVTDLFPRLGPSSDGEADSESEIAGPIISFLCMNRIGQ